MYELFRLRQELAHIFLPAVEKITNYEELRISLSKYKDSSLSKVVYVGDIQLPYIKVYDFI